MTEAEQLLTKACELVDIEVADMGAPDHPRWCARIDVGLPLHHAGLSWVPFSAAVLQPYLASLLVAQVARSSDETRDHYTKLIQRNDKSGRYMLKDMVRVEFATFQQSLCAAVVVLE
jgi:hypothetical protein